MKRFVNFIVELILWFVAWLLQPVVELSTYIVVAFTYGFVESLNYWNGKGLSADYRSARDNRSLWNWLFLTDKSYKFTRTIDKTISRMIGINSQIKGGLSAAGWFMYYLLYAIDFTNWFKGGHCLASLQREDYKIINKYNGTNN